MSADPSQAFTAGPAVARPRVVCIAQARIGSTRLPGKVLRPVAGRPLLAHHLSRLGRCRRIDRLVLATTTAAADDPVAAVAAALGVAVFRGAEDDVLARFAGAADAFGAGVVVRTTADCPLIDPDLSDQVIARFLAAWPAFDYGGLDVTTFPRGLDTEVFGRAALDRAAAEATDPADREHVTRYFYTHPERFRILPPLSCEPPPPPTRWCVDEPADLELVRRLLETLLPDHPAFGWRDCLAVLDAHPDWRALNLGVRQKG